MDAHRCRRNVCSAQVYRSLPLHCALCGAWVILYAAGETLPSPSLPQPPKKDKRKLLYELARRLGRKIDAVKRINKPRLYGADVSKRLQS